MILNKVLSKVVKGVMHCYSEHPELVSKLSI